MVNYARVNIWGQRVGVVSWDEKRRLGLFEYEPAFIARGLDISPLQMSIHSPRVFSFPTLNTDTFYGLPGLLADSLPDAWGSALLDAWLARQGAAHANPIERLCYQGKRGMGALEFEPVMDNSLESTNLISVSDLVLVSKEVLKERASLKVNKLDDDGLLNMIKIGTSAGGARAKAIIAFNTKTGEIRSGQVDAPEGFEHWIIKLDGVTGKLLNDPSHYGRIEYAYYNMATDCGIEMTQCRLLEENSRAHFMTKRFDRAGTNKKFHLLTLCGLAHYDYKMAGAWSYEQLFQVMRILRLPYSDAEQMYRRMVFNVVARNQDDHTKNVSFIMRPNGKWELAPAYDMVYAYNPVGDWTNAHQLSINGKTSGVILSDLLTVAKNINIRKPKEIIEQIVSVVSSWKKYASVSEVPDYLFFKIGKAHRLNLNG